MLRCFPQTLINENKHCKDDQENMPKIFFWGVHENISKDRFSGTTDILNS
jgi:hypothetical protein